MQVVNVNYVLKIYKESSEYAVFTQEENDCRVDVHMPKGYNGTCDTFIASSSVKNYSVDILSVTDADITAWWCQIRTKLWIKNITLVLKCKLCCINVYELKGKFDISVPNTLSISHG